MITLVGGLAPEVLAVLVGVPLLVALIEVALQRVGGILVRILIGTAEGPEGEGDEEDRFHAGQGRLFSRLL